MLFLKSKTKVEVYKGESALKRGVKHEASRGYDVSGITSASGAFKPVKALLTGGLGYFTFGGLRRDDVYTVTYVRKA